MNRGLVGSFASPEALVEAILALRAAGFRSLDAYIPYPAHEVIDALDLPRSRVPFYALGGGIFGAGYAYLIQWWMNGFDYALNVGGRPLGSVPAFIPPTFEGAVLLTAFGAVAAFLGFSKLPRLWAPVADAPGFERASVDRFFVALDATDPAWDPDKARAILLDHGAEDVSLFGQPAGVAREEAT